MHKNGCFLYDLTGSRMTNAELICRLWDRLRTLLMQSIKQWKKRGIEVNPLYLINVDNNILNQPVR